MKINNENQQIKSSKKTTLITFKNQRK